MSSLLIVGLYVNNANPEETAVISKPSTETAAIRSAVRACDYHPTHGAAGDDVARPTEG